MNGWRLTAVVAFSLWAGACGSRRETELAPQVAGANPEDKLSWGRTSEVAGTPVMRIDLVGGGGTSSYSSYGDTRNVLFLDPADKAGHWLLPDSRHFFAETLELTIGSENGFENGSGTPRGKRVLGTAALIKLVDKNNDTSTGRLLLFNPVGRTVEWLSEGVRRLNAASVGPEGDWVLLYERRRQFVIAVVDGQTLRMKREQAFDIPALK